MFRDRTIKCRKIEKWWCKLQSRQQGRVCQIGLTNYRDSENDRERCTDSKERGIYGRIFGKRWRERERTGRKKERELWEVAANKSGWSGLCNEQNVSPTDKANKNGPNVISFSGVHFVFIFIVLQNSVQWTQIVQTNAALTSHQWLGDSTRVAKCIKLSAAPRTAPVMVGSA